MDAYKPKEVVEHLDKYIIGQSEAKRAVAIALRNRWRRHRLSDEMKYEVNPKNILMVGPTGCGKVGKIILVKCIIYFVRRQKSLEELRR